MLLFEVVSAGGQPFATLPNIRLVELLASPDTSADSILSQLPCSQEETGKFSFMRRNLISACLEGKCENRPSFSTLLRWTDNCQRREVIKGKKLAGGSNRGGGGGSSSSSEGDGSTADTASGNGSSSGGSDGGTNYLVNRRTPPSFLSLNSNGGSDDGDDKETDSLL